MRIATNHPWHAVDIGDDVPRLVNGVIEIPSGSREKYELDKKSGILRLDRVLYSAVHYPFNYGFVPQTLGEDNDPLDILVLSQAKVMPLCIVSARVIGVMRMLDHGEADDKIISVANNDMSVNHIHEVADLPAHFIIEAKNFFEDYKKLEKKTIVVEDFQDKATALGIINSSIEAYKAKYGHIRSFGSYAEGEDY